jgi:hypothetical protein
VLNYLLVKTPTRATNKGWAQLLVGENTNKGCAHLLVGENTNKGWARKLKKDSGDEG